MRAYSDQWGTENVLASPAPSNGSFRPSKGAQRPTQKVWIRKAGPIWLHPQSRASCSLVPALSPSIPCPGPSTLVQAHEGIEIFGLLNLVSFPSFSSPSNRLSNPKPFALILSCSLDLTPFFGVLPFLSPSVAPPSQPLNISSPLTLFDDISLDINDPNLSCIPASSADPCPSTPSSSPITSFSTVVSPTPSLCVDSSLPSPSCLADTGDRDWDLESYPFDLQSLVEKSTEMGHIFGLEQDEGQLVTNQIIISKAQLLHEKKVRNSRSKLDMELRRLGPLDAPVNGPRRRRKRRGEVGDES
ncbi:unnamed protein product [Linum trigynum]|uniref:Uncharacterized protein n=1 Tax=Linum trigynum TaxID=586398 RepID=A0AAV2DQ44_9ROSI